MRNVPWTCAQNGLELQARAGNFERAHGLLERIEKDGVQPNTVTYSSLVNGALQLFEAMVAKGVKDSIPFLMELFVPVASLFVIS
eukprot:symbB.v1.2.017718.t1/scaffold1384.1/size122353/8